MSHSDVKIGRTVLSLSPCQVRQICEIGEQGYPHEVCGILVGTVGSRARRVARVIPAANQRVDSAANRYRIDSREVLHLERQLEGSGESILGFFHSHPDVGARPSRHDRENAWPWYSYLIVSVLEGRADEFSSWRLGEDRSRFELEQIEIEDLNESYQER